MHSTVHRVEVHDKLCVIITCNSVESQRIGTNLESYQFLSYVSDTLCTTECRCV